MKYKHYFFTVMVIVIGIIFLQILNVQFSSDVKAMNETDQAKELLKQGREYHLQGGEEQLNKAVETIKQAIDLDPDNYLYYAVLGCNYYELGEYDKAQEAFSKAISLYPDDAETLVGIGNLHARNGNYEEAENWLKRAVSLHKNTSSENDVFTFLELGKFYTNQGEYDKAENTFLEGFEVNNESFELYFYYARLYFEQSKYEDAIIIYHNTIDTNQKHQWYNRALIGIGESYYFLGDYETAKTYFENLIDLEIVEEDWYTMYYIMAEIYVKEGKNSRAIEFLEKYLGNNYKFPEATYFYEKEAKELLATVT